MSTSHQEEAGSAHVDSCNELPNINMLGEHLLIKKDLKGGTELSKEFETPAGNPISNSDAAQALDSISSSRQSPDEPILAAGNPYYPSNLNGSNHFTNLSEQMPKSGRSSSASNMSTAGQLMKLYGTRVDEPSLETSYQDDPTYYHPSLLRSIRRPKAPDQHLPKLPLRLDQQTYSDGAIRPPTVLHDQSLALPGSFYAPQQPIDTGLEGGGQYHVLPTPDSSAQTSNQEGYGRSGENKRSKSNTGSSSWFSERSSFSVHQAHSVEGNDFEAANRDRDPNPRSKNMQGNHASDAMKHHAAVSISTRASRAESPKLKLEKKRKHTFHAADPASKHQRLNIEPPATTESQTSRSGTGKDKDFWDLWLESQVQDNKKLYSSILWTDQCQRLAVILKSGSQTETNLAFGAGVMVCNEEDKEKDESWIFENSSMVEMRHPESQVKEPLLAPGDGARPDHPSKIPKSLSTDSDIMTQLNTQVSARSRRENEPAPVNNIEFRKPSTMALSLPTKVRSGFDATRTASHAVAATTASISSAQSLVSLSPAKKQRSVPAVRTPKRRRILDVQDPGPRNFLGHEARLLHELHNHLKPSASHPSDRSGWSTFLSTNGPAWKSFLSRNETASETKARGQAIAEHKIAVEEFEKGEKARERQAHRQRKEAATAASQAKIKAMTEKNLQKRADNPDVPWRELRQA